MNSKHSDTNILLLTPSIYKHENKVYDIEYNPCYDLMALSDISGRISLLKFDDENERVLTNYKSINVGTESITSINYSNTGESKYKSIYS